MPDAVGREFMEKTKGRYLGPSDQQRGAPPPPLTVELGKGVAEVALPPPDKLALKGVDLLALVTGRSSVRQYARTPLAIEELSFLVWCTQGIKEVHAPTATLRTVPSAGARHAFETLLLVHRVEGLEAGLYQYDPVNHGLRRLEAEARISRRVTQACYGQDFVGTSAVTFLWVAVPYRMNWRYGERGYRYVHLDAGHVCQNLYLGAEAIGAGACAVAAFDDDALNAVLGLDGDTMFVIYLAAVGKRR